MAGYSLAKPSYPAQRAAYQDCGRRSAARPAGRAPRAPARRAARGARGRYAAAWRCKAAGRRAEAVARATTLQGPRPRAEHQRGQTSRARSCETCKAAKHRAMRGLALHGAAGRATGHHGPAGACGSISAQHPARGPSAAPQGPCRPRQPARRAERRAGAGVR